MIWKKRLIAAAFVLLSFLYAGGLAVWAADADADSGFAGAASGSASSSFDVQQYMDEQLRASGAEDLEAPEQARDALDALEIDGVTPEKILGITPGKMGEVLTKLAAGKLVSPLAAIAVVFGVMIVCALLDGLRTAATERTLDGVFSAVSTLCIAAVIVAPIAAVIQHVGDALKACSVFMLSFIPVLSGITVAGGQPASATAYNMALFGVCEVVSQIAVTTIVPLLCIYLAFTIVGGVTPSLKLDGLSGGIKTVATTVLSFIVTVLVAMLTIQSLVGNAADSVGVRAAKFAIGSFIPVVGGPLADVFSSVQGCVRLLKTTVGTFGIVVAGFTFLPVLVETLIWMLAAKIAGAVADLLSLDKISGILKACGTVLGLLLAIVLCFMLLIIVSTTIVVMLGTGT